MLLGFFTIFCVYYSNSNWTAYFPINSNKLFDGKGRVYNVPKILDNLHAFEDVKYRQYGPPYFSANLALYGAYFFMYPSTIAHHFVTE